MEDMDVAGPVVAAEGFEAVFAVDGSLEQERWERAAARVRFEDLLPVSAFPVVPGKRWGPGWWWSATTGGHVAHGSAAMVVQLMLLDRDPQVVGISGRPLRVLWREGDGRVRSWVPQVFARYADGTAMLADCPGAPGAGGVAAQRAGAAVGQACARVGWVYRRLRAPDPVVVGNVRWLAGYRHPRFRGAAGVEEAVLEAFSCPRPLVEGVRAVGNPLVVLPVVYHALWAHRLRAPLERPLHGGTLLRPGSAWAACGSRLAAGAGSGAAGVGGSWQAAGGRAGGSDGRADAGAEVEW
ncbi:TnsA-like heteromeric transposase endonuclease subunit [Kitasatospora sp. NPDC090308]|uniref:TnsA-like heteromeric transposase endonuclease subunit n=1 Tax=Kitasatospora sp. NPDC090308 TaxID=3364082 RepID=UPI00382CC7E4